MKECLPRILGGLVAVGVCLLLTACSSGEPKSKVDLAKQLEALKSADAKTRQDALMEIAALKADAAPAVPALIECLSNDKDRDCRSFAAYALGEIGLPGAAKAIPALKTALSDPHREVAGTVLSVLRKLDPKSVEGASIPNVTQPVER